MNIQAGRFFISIGSSFAGIVSVSWCDDTTSKGGQCEIDAGVLREDARLSDGPVPSVVRKALRDAGLLWGKTGR